MRWRTAPILLVAVLGLLLLPAQQAAANAYDDVEARLKSSGVGAPLAREIAAAIRNGARWLSSVQWEHGQIGRTPGETVLSALALMHTGHPDAHAAAKRALDWLKRSKWTEVRTKTYEAGIAAMLLQALGPKDPRLKDIHKRLARGASAGGGYWGYRSSGGDGSPNLSTAQFGCLGMWAAERTGIERAARTWQVHRGALLLAQTVDGSWGYRPGPAAPERSYATGTFMGLADLVLAEDPTPPDPDDNVAFRRWSEARRARHSGEAALARHARWTLLQEAPQAGLSGASRLDYYRLYALEKAALFLDRESIAGFDWYVEGARQLLPLQGDDGRWGPLGAGGRAATGSYATVPTAFALLFLLRASETYRPTTPRALPVPKARPSTPVTPGHGPAEDEALPPDDGADDDPLAGAPPLPLARTVLTRLIAAAKRPRAKHVHSLDSAFRFVRRTLPRYAPDGRPLDTLHAAWVRQAEAALVDLAIPKKGTRVTHDAWRVVLAIQALDVLGAATPTAGIALRDRLEGSMLARPAHRHARIGYYHAAFRCLRQLDAPEIARWLVRHAISADDKDLPTTIPALLAWERLVPPSKTVARERAKTLLARLRPLLRRQSSRIESDLGTDLAIALARVLGRLDELRAAGLARTWLTEVARELR